MPPNLNRLEEDWPIGFTVKGQIQRRLLDCLNLKSESGERDKNTSQALNSITRTLGLLSKPAMKQRKRDLKASEARKPDVRDALLANCGDLSRSDDELSRF